MSRTFHADRQWRDAADHRRDILEEIYLSEVEYELDSVFIIISTDVVGGYDIPEIFEGEYHITKTEAWEKLASIAALHDVELNQNEYTFTVPTPIKGVEDSYYYIQELWRG